MTRAFLLSLALLAGCNAEDPTGPFEDEQANIVVEQIVDGIVGPTATHSPLACPDLEDGMFGEFECTSAVDGEDVSWSMTVRENPAGGAAFDLVPDYGSPSADAKWALLKAFRDDFGVVMTSVTCPPADAAAQTISCQVALEDLSFDAEFTLMEGQQFRYTYPGISFKRGIEQVVANGLVGEDGPQAVVECDAPPVFEDVPGLEFMCQAHSPETGQRATVRYLVGNEPGQFQWDIVLSPGT